MLLRLRGDVGEMIGRASNNNVSGQQRHRSANSPRFAGVGGGAVSMVRATSNTNIAHMALAQSDEVHSGGGSVGGASSHASAEEASSDIRAALFVSINSLQGLGSIVGVLDALTKTLRDGTGSGGGGGSGDQRAVPAGVGGNPFGGRRPARASVGHLYSASSTSGGPRGLGRLSGGSHIGGGPSLLKDSLPQSVLHVLMPPAKKLQQAGAVPSDMTDAELSRQL